MNKAKSTPALGYLQYCEQLFQNWKDGAETIEDFSGDFCMNCVPEPYSPIQPGRNPLFVLNYNPGQPLRDIQAREVILEKHPNDTFSQVAEALAAFYNNGLKARVHQAWQRFARMKEYAKWMGYDGVQNVEAFFLHSKNINARQFQKQYGNHPMVLEYTGLLKDYLREKPVMAIAAVGSNASITSKTLAQDKWVSWVLDIIGLQLAKARLEKIHCKDGKTTSAIVVQGNKYLVVTMGSNSLPKMPEPFFRKITG